MTTSSQVSHSFSHAGLADGLASLLANWPEARQEATGRVPAAGRLDRQAVSASLSDSQVRDVFKVCGDMPQLEDVQFTFYVEDEEEIAEGDLVTLRVQFTRGNLKDGTYAPPVHAPLFPASKQETWWVLVSYSKTGSLVLAEKIADRSKYVDFRVKLVAPPAASYNFYIDLKSSDYLGLDIRTSLIMKVVSAATLPEYKPHQEDLDLDDEPTLFEQVMNTAVDDSSDDEKEEPNLLEDDDDSDQDTATLTLAERRRRQARIKRKKAKLLTSQPPPPSDDDDDEVSPTKDD